MGEMAGTLRKKPLIPDGHAALQGLSSVPHLTSVAAPVSMEVALSAAPRPLQAGFV